MGLTCWSDPSYKNAYHLAVTGCVLEFIFSGAGIAGYVWFGSAMCLVYGLENLVDFLSSAVVLWRFYAPGTLTKEREAVLKQREIRAGVAISIIIAILGISVVAAAVAELVKQQERFQEDNGIEILMAIAFLSVVIFSIMTVLKFQYARKLDSESLRKDGICSVIGVVLSIAIFANVWIMNEKPNLWKFDGAFAIFCGGIALGVGVHGMVVARFYQKLPIFRLAWWQNRDGKDETMPDQEIETTEPPATKLSAEVV